MNKEIIAKAAEIIESGAIQGGKNWESYWERGQVCILSLIDEQGFPTASVITPSKADGINWLTFGSAKDGNSMKRSLANPRASLCFGSPEYSINLVGEIEVITDNAIKNDMWYEGLTMHFTGPDDPSYCVLRFTTKRYKLFVGDGVTEGEL